MHGPIVVGTDGSATAGKAVTRAVELAKALGARMHLVMAYEATSGSRQRDETEPDPENRDWAVNPRALVDETLREAAEEAKALGVDCEVHAREGEAAEAILNVAEELQAELIVVGNRGMRGAQRFLLGSVPNKVSHHAPCSVLIVRTI